MGYLAETLCVLFGFMTLINLLTSDGSRLLTYSSLKDLFNLQFKLASY